MEQFLIAALGSVAVILALILGSTYRARPPAGGQPQRGKGVSVAIVAVAGLLLLASLAAAGFSAWQWRAAAAHGRELAGQTRALEAQLHRLASRQHRAWVHATPSLAGPMIIKDRNVSLATHYRVENTGEAPAIGVQISSAVIPHVDVDVVALQKSLCEPRPPEQAAAPPTRDSLFPKESRGVSRIEGVGADLVDRHIAQQRGARLEFWWVGCVGYQTLGDPTRHHSGFIYEIAETGAGPHGIVPISLADQIIPKNRLVILPYSRGGFPAD
ncbi:MAG TPA: hypothetical protein VND95_09100 [Stellaceae bacterium]|nr:hypothetical protein [Stellaceae bacterium]